MPDSGKLHGLVYPLPSWVITEKATTRPCSSSSEVRPGSSLLGGHRVSHQAFPLGPCAPISACCGKAGGLRFIVGHSQQALARPHPSRGHRAELVAACFSPAGPPPALLPLGWFGNSVLESRSCSLCKLNPEPAARVCACLPQSKQLLPLGPLANL